MQNNQQQPQMVQQTACTDEKLLAAFEEINFLREQVEFLHELVESQNLCLHEQQNQVQELEEELNLTNEQLCNSPCFNSFLDASCP